MSSDASGGVRPHILVVWVEDLPGVLNRVTSLFRRRGFNIESLSVGHARAPGVSRMTIVVHTDPGAARRLFVQLVRLVNVLRVDDITHEPAIHHELAMFKIAAKAEERTQVIQLAGATGARLVDIAPESVVIEATASPQKIDGLAEVLRPYGILELVRTGLVGMARGAASVMTDPVPRNPPKRRRAPEDDGSGSHSV
jgi:acetolactate synthase-1/3 small subunit